MIFHIKTLYRLSEIPDHEKNFLLEYTFMEVTEDCNTFILEFNNYYTIEGECNFLNYIYTKEEFNKTLQQVNNVTTNTEDSKRQTEAVKKVVVAVNTSDLQQKIHERHHKYNLLRDDF